MNKKKNITKYFKYINFLIGIKIGNLTKISHFAKLNHLTKRGHFEKNTILPC